MTSLTRINTSAMQPRFQGKWQTCCWVWRYDLCYSKTLLPWIIFELGNDRMLSVNSIFSEAPVKVQISCNLKPCRLSKLIIITTRQPVWGRQSQDGKQEIYLEWPKVRKLQGSNLQFHLPSTMTSTMTQFLLVYIDYSQTAGWEHGN